jgi:hypothetical protein
MMLLVATCGGGEQTASGRVIQEGWLVVVSETTMKVEEQCGMQHMVATRRSPVEASQQSM